MKIRTGFVSNSSSASFLIGIGVLEDRSKLGGVVDLEKNMNIEIYTLEDYFKCRGEVDRIDMEAGGGIVWTSISVKGLPPETEIIEFLSCGDVTENDWGEVMSAELDDFAAKDVDLVQKMASGEIGVTNFEWSYGAGRDG